MVVGLHRGISTAASKGYPILSQKSDYLPTQLRWDAYGFQKKLLIRVSYRSLI